MRIIDADELFKKLSTLSVDGSNSIGQGYYAAISDVSYLIVNAPTVDTVKHGKWLYKGMDGDWQWHTDGRGNCWSVVECSVCHKQFRGRGCGRYCSCCGAKMEGE